MHVLRYFGPSGLTCRNRQQRGVRGWYLPADKVPATCKVPSPAAGGRCYFREGTIPGCWSRSGACANSARTVHLTRAGPLGSLGRHSGRGGSGTVRPPCEMHAR